MKNILSSFRDADGRIRAYEMKIVTEDKRALEVKFDPDGKVLK